MTFLKFTKEHRWTRDKIMYYCTNCNFLYVNMITPIPPACVSRIND